MENDYIRQMQNKESLCLQYMRQAERVLARNENRHSKEECDCLRQALQLRSEMAQMSTGAEADYQRRKALEVKNRLETAIRAINPNAAAAMEPKKAEQSAGKAAGGGKSGSSSSTAAGKKAAGKKQDVSDEDVAGWFKEAPKHSFDQVSGMEKVKEQLKSCVENEAQRELRKYLKMRQLNSFFFIGPPGCGKTYIIEAFAHELMQENYQYLSLVSSDILSRYVGEAEKIVTRLFEEAEKHAPCIVFIDEVDGVCKNRSLPGLPEYASSITTAFLTGYNRIHSSDAPIIFIGATNYPNQVDNAMLDRVELVRIPLPDQAARAYAFARHFKDMLLFDEDITYEDMAELTENYNYRDIDHLVERIKKAAETEAIEQFGSESDALNAIRAGEYMVSRNLFDRVQENFTPSPKDDILRELDAWEKRFRVGEG